MWLLRSLPIPALQKLAAQYQPIVTQIEGAHDGAASTQHSSSSATDKSGQYISALGLTHNPSRDWSGALTSHADLHAETGAAYVLPNFIDKVVPLFVVSILVELIVLRAQVKRRATKRAAAGQPAAEEVPAYRLNDSLNSMSLGMLQQMFHLALFVRPLIYAPYVWVWENYALIRLPLTWWSWLLAFLLIEFAYYWYHRMGHEMNIFWAAHIAHHSSESYNLTTALRQGAIQYSASFVFNLPAAFLIPPPLFSFHQHLNRINQFWIHTRIIDKLPAWVEFVFNTPSHHRTHHGANAGCIDVNYGGTLIIFDRIFDTFMEESDALRKHKDPELVYGLTHNVRSWNPLWANAHHWNYMVKATRHLGWSWRRLEVLWQRPGWVPPSAPAMKSDGGSSASMLSSPEEERFYPIPSVVPRCRAVYDRMCLKGAGNVAYALVGFGINGLVLRLIGSTASQCTHTNARVGCDRCVHRAQSLLTRCWCFLFFFLRR